MKTGCLIFSNNKKYNKLHDCAVNSFIKFHKDVYTFSVKENSEIYNEIKEDIYKFPAGIQKFFIASYLFRELSLDKIIVLGADTITCDRLNEFTQDNENDILTTLDYPYQLKTSNNHILSSADKENHVNADVVCFNNLNCLDDIIKSCFEIRTEYYEQAALNYICNISKKYKNKIVDGDYQDSDVVYNARAKGNLCAAPNTKPWFKYTQLFNVKQNKLFTGLHENITKEKQIKVWHYCDALGTMDKHGFEENINNWINKGFNTQTKEFFTEQCECGNFFNETFVI